MPAASHKIADAVFNFSFASADETVRGAAVLPGLIKAQLVPCMDEVFNRMGRGQDVVRIDRLAVDLGCVAYEDMARVLAQRLEQALHAALKDRLAADHPPGPYAVRRIPPHLAGLDLITRYLQTGTVPWTAEKSSPADLNHLLMTLIDRVPQILLAFLQSQTQKANPVLPRLARQFNPDLLLRLAACLAPAAAPALNHLVNAFAVLHKAAGSASVSSREWAGALWEGILRQLLMPGGCSMSPCILVANALQTAAARHHISRSRLFQYLTRAWQRQRTTAGGMEAGKLVIEVLGRLDPESAAHEDPQPTADPWVPLKSMLQDAIVHNRMDGFNRAWPVMVTRFAGPTRQVIRQTARQSQVRRTIARRFLPRQFRQLVVLLEPRHAHFINNVLEHQKILVQAMPRASAPPETMGCHLREFTLAYLLSEGATRFNRKQYCAGLIRRLAARHNMTCEALLEDFHTFFSSAIAAHDDTGRQLKEILDEIRGHPVNTETRPPEKNGPPQGISLDLPSRMRTGLRHGRTSAKQPAASGRGVDVMSNEPAQHCPVPSAALLHGLDPEETHTSVALAEPVPEEIRAVLGRDITRSSLTAALERLAGHHPHWSRFLSHALLEMGRGMDPVDLIQHLIRSSQKTGGATAPGMFYRELRRELAALGLLSQAADEPSRISETACCPRPSETQLTASNRPLPKELQEVLGRDIRLAGLTATLERLAGHHPNWSRFLSHALLDLGRGMDPVDLIQHLIRCLQKTGGATAPDVFYQELRRELAAVGPRSHGAERLPAQMAVGHDCVIEPSALAVSQTLRTRREPAEAAAPDPSVFVQNAGLVLVAPYLSRLFGMLGLMAESRFNNCTAAERAVHLLEFIANERTTAPEFQLVLNKILCGMAVSMPITPGINITPKEKSAVDSLIRGIIDNWKILGNTSPEGLRTAFLQREGYLTLKDDTWHLRVEERSYDMLLDRLPWSYAVIKHPWMTRMLQVNWRSS